MCWVYSVVDDDDEIWISKNIYIGGPRERVPVPCVSVRMAYPHFHGYYVRKNWSDSNLRPQNFSVAHKPLFHFPGNNFWKSWIYKCETLALSLEPRSPEPRACEPGAWARSLEPLHTGNKITPLVTTMSNAEISKFLFFRIPVTLLSEKCVFWYFLLWAPSDRSFPLCLLPVAGH
jgi:hypothetical protein